MERSDGSFQELIPSFHHVGLRDQAQSARLDSGCLSPLSQLTDSGNYCFLKLTSVLFLFPFSFPLCN